MGDLLVLKNADVMDLYFASGQIVEMVEASILALARGTAENPTKIAINPGKKNMAISMMGRMPSSGTIGFKSYAEFPTNADRIRGHSTITLVEEQTGSPYAFMDCEWITATRTGAVTGLIARHAARRGARTALIIGAGQQARQIVPMLFETVPGLDEVLIYGRRRDAVEAIIREHRSSRATHQISYCADPAEDARRADIVIGASGAGTPDLVRLDMLRRGALVIYVGHGVGGDVLHGANRVIATSEQQMQVTGLDLLDGHNRLPAVHAELPDIVAGRMPARLSDDQIVAAYNSGLTVTDIAVATAIYDSARQRAVGNLVVGF